MKRQKSAGNGAMWQVIRTLVFVSAVAALAGCAHSPGRLAELEGVVPLYPAPDSPTAATARLLAPTPDLLALTPAMRDFVDRYVISGTTSRQRLNLLHGALRSKALLGVEYDPAADGSAAQVFANGSANCLSYAHLFISMARYAGLDAHYQSLDLRPEWSRHGDRVALRQHVNVLVKVRRGEHYMVDLDPVQRSAVAGARTLSDQQAFALHHNNLAMQHLYSERIEQAYRHAVSAVLLSPGVDYLRVNLGVIYSRAGNELAAEQSYQTALQLDNSSQSAMNNLQLLYTRRGDTELAAHWEAQVARHRERNPYYRVFLAEQAEQAGDYDAAVEHYRAAIRRKSDDAEFYFRLGKLYSDLQQAERSIKYVQLAIEHARVVSERKQYQAFLEQLTGRSLAQLL